MGDNNFFDSRNMLISLKAIVVSIIAFLIMVIPSGLIFLLVRNNQGFIIIGILNLIAFLIYLFLWGYFANRLWGWE